MEERKFIKLNKEEFGVKEYIKKNLGKGKISKLDIEYTPIGEKILIFTSKPGLIIGRGGKKIEELTEALKKRFKLENPHIEIKEIKNPLLDAQTVADDIAYALERMGNLKFKVIAYKKLQEIMNNGALGCEIRLSGKLPSDRAKSWRFANGYLKKSGESSKVVDRTQAVALTKTGIIGIKVAIMPPDAKIIDKIDVNEEMKRKIREVKTEEPEKSVKKEKKVEKKIKGTKKEDSKKKSKEKVIKEIPEIKPLEFGTAIKIEEKIEESVPKDVIDEELNEELEKDKNNKGEYINKK